MPLVIVWHIAEVVSTEFLYRLGSFVYHSWCCWYPDSRGRGDIGLDYHDGVAPRDIEDLRVELESLLLCQTLHEMHSSRMR